MHLKLALLLSPVFLSTGSFAIAGTTSCRTVAACVLGVNSSTGYGVEGASRGNDGVVGFTSQNATSASTGKAGVAGYDSSTNKKTYNSGVYGTSSYGDGVQGKSANGYGVFGTTSANSTSSTDAKAAVIGRDLSTNNSGITYSGFNAGVAGTSTNGMGVSGDSTYGNGVLGSTYEGTGVEGSATLGFGVIGTSGNYVGVYGLAYPALAIGVEGSSLDGTGVFAVSDTGAALTAQSNSGAIFTGNAGKYGYDVVSIDHSGNMILAGSLTMKGSPLVRTASTSGPDVASYTARASSPTIEDFGKASLRLGVAYVPIEATFASTMNQRAGYMVFITPEGDSRGLYTTNLSANSFEVHENSGGHSSLTFAYRIVAKPGDTASARLPAMSTFPQLQRSKTHRTPPPSIARRAALH